MSQLHSYFEPIVRKQRRLNRVFSVVMFAVAAVGLGWGTSLGASDHQTARMVVYSVVCLPLCLFLLVWNIWPHRGLERLRDPSRIVWHYGVQKGGAVNAVMIGFDDKKLVRFHLPHISMKKGFSQDAFQHLRQCAPQAATGYSEELRKAFRADPSSLKR